MEWNAECTPSPIISSLKLNRVRNQCGCFFERVTSGGIIRTILIYRDELLNLSETFISAQVATMKVYHPIYVGLSRVVQGLPISSESVLLSNSRSIPARIRKVVYRMTGVAPGFHRRVAAANGQLLHAHFALDATNALSLMSELRLPVVVTLHGYDVTIHDSEWRKTAKGRRYLKRREALWANTSLFLCVSEFIRDVALRSGFPKEKLEVHRIGINRQEFASIKREESEPLVLFVGRLVEKKGCSHLLRAMRTVQAEMPTAELVLIGYGDLRPSLEVQAAELGVRCRFLGPQSSTEVRDWMRRARVLAAPSVTAINGDSEGLPTVIVEAHAMGLPVVGYRHAGIPEIVKTGVTGLLSEEGDTESLARDLLRYLKDDEFWLRSSIAASAWVAESFDMRVQTEKLEAIYSNVMDSFQSRLSMER